MMAMIYVKLCQWERNRVKMLTEKKKKKKKYVREIKYNMSLKLVSEMRK